LADRAYSKNAASLTDSKEVETEDNFHYTAFIYKNGYLWEIDGLKPRPVKIGACTSENWLKLAEPVLKHRVEVM
jgi:ubiquitin carboxyl-terminal hydrolase L5